MERVKRGTDALRGAAVLVSGKGRLTLRAAPSLWGFRGACPPDRGKKREESEGRKEEGGRRREESKSGGRVVDSEQ